LLNWEKHVQHYYSTNVQVWLKLILIDVDLTFADMDPKWVRTDGSLEAECRTLTPNLQPFLVIEVANTQTELDVMVKAREYVEGAHGRISVIVIVKIDPEPECKTRLWIWKARCHTCSTEKHPEGFLTTYTAAINELEIYPNFDSTNAAFELTTRDLFPQHRWADLESSIHCDLTRSIDRVREKIEAYKEGNLVKVNSPRQPNTPDKSDAETTESSDSSESESQSEIKDPSYRP